MIDPRPRTADLPLFSYGEQLRAAYMRRRRRGRWVIAIGGLAFSVAATIAMPPRPILVWNASASAPIGLYAVTGKTGIRKGDMVIARTPSAVRILADRRSYIPLNVPLVKRVAGVSGDTICGQGRTIFVGGHPVAERGTSDPHGRPMPWWSGCITLQGGAVLLLNDRPDSFDGRYFGPSAQGDIIGKAHLLWAR